MMHSKEPRLWNQAYLNLNPTMSFNFPQLLSLCIKGDDNNVAVEIQWPDLHGVPGKMPDKQ